MLFRIFVSVCDRARTTLRTYVLGTDAKGRGKIGRTAPHNMVSEPVKTEISFVRQGRNRPMEWCCCCDPGLDCLAQCSHITKEAVLLPVSIDASWVKDLQEREGKLKKVSSLGKTAHVYTCVSIRSAMAGSDRDLHACRLQSERERLVLPIATIVATVDNDDTSRSEPVLNVVVQPIYVFTARRGRLVRSKNENPPRRLSGFVFLFLGRHP